MMVFTMEGDKHTAKYDDKTLKNLLMKNPSIKLPTE